MLQNGIQLIMILDGNTRLYNFLFFHHKINSENQILYLLIQK